MEAPSTESLDAIAVASDANLATSDLKADEQSKPSPLPSPLDEQRIQKAESFLRNEDLNNVSSSAKREFLEKKVGLTTDEVNLAMERVAKREGMGRLGNRRDQEISGLDDRYDYHRDLHNGIYNERNRHMFDRRTPYETQSMHARPPYHDPNNTDSFNNYPPPERMEDPDKSSFSITSWIGGFSLGVFCLAAVRWLNGGDFILFPPPTASDREIDKEIRVEENCASESDEQEAELTFFLGDVAETEEEDEYEVKDGAVSSILNGTSNAHDHHPTDIQPSYEDLVLEIRALTSAVHSYREEQERTNRATVAKVGRGVTDDVMDFLRLDKQKSKNNDEAVISKIVVENINSLLNEVSSYLTSVKDNFTHDENEGATAESIDSSNDDGKLRNNADLFANAVSLLAKLQQAIESLQTATKEKPSMNELDPVDDDDDKSSELCAIGTNKKMNIENYIGEVGRSTDEQKSSDTLNDIDVNNQTNTPESNEPVDREPKASEEPGASAEDVEEALRKLSNENGVEELKTGTQMLYLYCMNISKNPSVPRYRKIYTNNNTFQKKIGNLNGADELLQAVGFVKKTNFYEWAKLNTESMETQSSLDLALIALDLMRKGTKNDEQPSSPADQTKEEVSGAQDLSTE